MPMVLKIRRILIIKSPLTVRHFAYVDYLEFSKLLKENQNEFCILSLNIQSLNARFDELVILLLNLTKTHCKFNAICIQESWLHTSQIYHYLKLMDTI